MRTKRLTGDRGAVLIVAAVFTIVAVIMLAFVIDVGGLRAERKNVTLSTDAAALAAAGAANLDGVATGAYSCASVPTDTAGTTVEDVARTFLSANGRSVPASFPCEVIVTADKTGYVAVGADGAVDYSFGRAVGQSRGTTSGASLAAIKADPGGGIRPIGVCQFEQSLNDDPSDGSAYDITVDVIDAPKTADPDGNMTQLVTPVDVLLEKNHLKKSENACGTDDGAGQRGQLDLDGNGGGNGGQCTNSPKDGSYSDDVAEGHHGPIDQEVEPDSGNDFNSVKTCLTQLVQSGERFWVPVYDDYVKDKSDRYYTIKHFLEVSLKGYCLNGEYQETNGTHACEFVIDDSDPKKPVTSEWYRFDITRVFTPTSFPAAPPLTSDAELLPPTLCGEEDSAAARAACVAP